MVVHPTTVDAVAWASGVQDLMMTAALLAAVVVAVADGKIRWGSVAMLVAAALLCKETAVAAPLVLAVLWVPRWPTATRHRWLCVFAATGVVLFYLAVRFVVAPPPASYAQWPSSYVVKELIVRPFASLAVPWHEHTLREWPLLGVASASSASLLVGGRSPGSALTHLEHAGVVRCGSRASAPVYSYFSSLRSRRIPLPLSGDARLALVSHG